MRNTASFLTYALMATAIWLGPLGSHSEAGQRYSYRTGSYRAYRSRPSYRVRHYSYRPYYRYYRPYYRSYGYYRPYYYSRFYRGGYWPSWGWGRSFYSPSFGIHFGYVSAPRYYAGGVVDYSYRNGAVKMNVEPKQTEVYADGHYAGIVDDFDGIFQRLYLPPGQHEISLRLDGYRTYRQDLHINSGRTYKLHHTMQPLDPGETTTPPPSPEPERNVYEERPRTETPRPQEKVYRDEEPRASREPQRRPPRVSAPSRFGMLSLRVQPPEAQIVIDGQLWGTAVGLEELIIHLRAGHHAIEIRLEGFEPFSTEVEILEGQTTSLNVKLNGFRL